MRPPDLQGETGRAWRIPLPPLGQRDRPDQDATLDAWLVNDPTFIAGGAWQWWMVAVIHLRPLPGVPPAQIRRPDATHEIMMLSINPDTIPAGGPDPDNPKPQFSFLTPYDLCHQVLGLTDERARRLCELAVEKIIRDRCPPDHCTRTMWEGIIDGTAACIAQGKHDRQ